MLMIVNNLKKEIDSKILLNNISFTLNNNDKVILIGENGVGKSTLLKILNNDLPKDSGNINYENESISMLKQEINSDDYNKTILDYVKEQTGIEKLENRLHFLENNLNDSNMNEYGDVLNSYMQKDGYNFQNNLNLLKNGLNLNENINCIVGNLSGGEKIKVLLSIVLLDNSDIILLDEPTNNLDCESINYLCDFLIKSKKKMIIVSHDEDFISKIGNKIWELKDGKIKEYNMDYDEYQESKENEYNQRKLEHQKKIDEQNKLKSNLEKTKEWENKGLNKKGKDNDKIASGYQKERTKNTSSKISKLKEQLNDINYDDGFREKESINFFVDTSANKEPMDIYLDNLVCGYDNFKTMPINLKIPFGTRMQIVGSNGTGKTTLIKTIIGNNKPISGKILIGTGVKFGYISQDSFDSINDQETVEDYILKNNDVDKSYLYTLLDKFNISYDDKEKIYSKMSPGERTRINLAKLAMDKVNTLVLDEATNHLDIEAIHILEDVVDSFNGTIISVSHNKRFTEKLNPNINLDITTGKLIDNDINR
jgi:ATP-binding cassette subfamily F protein 3